MYHEGIYQTRRDCATNNRFRAGCHACSHKKHTYHVVRAPCDAPRVFQARADDLAEARAADTESSADRAAREAVVRRLDNERQYLKSQLQSEITCKDELREALNTATRQLGDIKVAVFLSVSKLFSYPKCRRAAQVGETAECPTLDFVCWEENEEF